ncbi:hypothetical protein Mapa_018542 [Marchantia paleacea]|nr:hypothetical protein Mapa_018542 [Marchantia paleacea]
MFFGHRLHCRVHAEHFQTEWPRVAQTTLDPPELLGQAQNVTVNERSRSPCPRLRLV